MKLGVQNNAVTGASRIFFWFVPPIVTFWGTLVANEVQKIPNVGARLQFGGNCLRAPSWLRHWFRRPVEDNWLKFLGIVWLITRSLRYWHQHINITFKQTSGICIVLYIVSLVPVSRARWKTEMSLVCAWTLVSNAIVCSSINQSVNENVFNVWTKNWQKQHVQTNIQTTVLRPFDPG